MKIGRNEPCPCGSGKKYKRCCEGDGRSTTRKTLFTQALLALAGFLFILFVISIVDAFYSSDPNSAGADRVWSAAHGHWHDKNGRKVP